MDLSEDQKEVAIELFGKDYVSGVLQALEKEQVVVSLYGDYEETSLSELSSQVQSINKFIKDEIRPTLEDLYQKTTKQFREFESRISSLENVIEPDKTDVHNIDRRIELLAQRIAEMESHTKIKRKGFTGKIWRFDKE